MNEPKLYRKHKSLQTTDNIYVIENFLKLIQWKNCENQTALDVGCGDGLTTMEILLPKLPKSLNKLLGCDVSDKMIKFAKEVCKNGQLDFCQLNIGNSEDCMDYHASFDYVFSFYCLHWIPDQRSVFENIYNMLKPGGDILLSFLGTNPIFDVYQNISKKIIWAKYLRPEMISPYHNCEDPGKVLKKMLLEIGFENCKCVVEDRQFIFPNLKLLEGSIVAVNPTLPQLDSEEKVQYLEDFMNEIAKIYKYDCDNNNEGKIDVNYKLIIVYASKPN
ncbi:unnamed protein product [Ceutorhynchus assimilis]|uniref:Methyltransferase type 12 domain-containing protein n=1 Tax=Ceutorhynchus assimilis TaxID=467358 RepID=A0A9N9QF70_9CUCU|nr:unnamed protein product [Ceutorhynchus assimilis]